MAVEQNSGEFQVVETPIVDTSAQQQTEQQTTSRDAVRDAIAQRRRDALRAEVAASGEGIAEELNTAQQPDQQTTAETTTTPAAHTDTTPAQQPAAKTAASQQAAEAQQLMTDDRVSVNIGGQTVLLTKDELSNLVQEGARARISAQQAAQTQATTQTQLQTTPATQQQAPAVDLTKIIPDNVASQIYERLITGSEDDGIAAIRELTQTIAQNLQQSMPQQQQIDVAALERNIINRVSAQATEQQQLQGDVQVIMQEYPEISNNDRLSRFAQDEIRALAVGYQRAGVQKSRLDLMREACGNVRAAMGLQPAANAATGQVTDQAANGRAAEATTRNSAAKRSMQQQPRGVGNVGSPAQTQQAAPSRSQVVDNMRKARGQMPFSNA